MQRNEATNGQPDPPLDKSAQAHIAIAPEARMAPPGSVVVGLSGSVASLAALHWAIRYASLSDARCIPWRSGTRTFSPRNARSGSRSSRPRRSAGCGTQWTKLEADERTADLHTHLDEGDPATILLAEAHDAELLVLGNHRHGALRNAVFGSVALRCMHDATCPVVVVPRPE